MRIGKKIYYEKDTGNVILHTGELEGAVIPKTVDQDIKTYKALSERNRDTFDYIQLEYGQYAQDFAESNSYRVNPETKELEFSYPDPNLSEEEREIVYQTPLTEQVKILETGLMETSSLLAAEHERNNQNEQAIMELSALVTGGNA